jgi:hypothetical protein
MSDCPIITIPAAADVYVVPAYEANATAIPIRDEETRPLLDEEGIPICQETLWQD